ncbi:hypothetical protein L6164_008018 [Bauhinia variegata]|uniref:Uncharacterized protein n=1 Tax=Bauhinia variegata TaxID=167791 RepID=A0ACB9PFQ2_BAUVA|nr:hypothetical protein L6164_008018 [Bauhinia variegata]
MPLALSSSFYSFSSPLPFCSSSSFNFVGSYPIIQRDQEHEYVFPNDEEEATEEEIYAHVEAADERDDLGGRHHLWWRNPFLVTLFTCNASYIVHFCGEDHVVDGIIENKKLQQEGKLRGNERFFVFTPNSRLETNKLIVEEKDDDDKELYRDSCTVGSNLRAPLNGGAPLRILNPYDELEAAYVAQIYLTWEALNWNYKNFQSKKSLGRVVDDGYPATIGQQFQQFQVLLQRYTENEPYEHGRRPEVYARMRLLAPKLLSVPEYREEAAQACLFKISGLQECEREKMNHCGYQQNAFASCEMGMESMVCPKPRRLGLFNHSSINDNIRPFRWPINYQSEIEDSGVGEELLDIIRPKESYAGRSGNQVASSPPFFCGSPPSRASNPVIQDEQFGNGNFSPFSVVPSSPSPSARGCVSMKFGQKPAAVRIEGFDCLSRDRRNRSISAVA